MKLKRFLLIGILLFISNISSAETASEKSSGTDSVIVHAELDNAILTIGDRVHYKISVTHPSKISIANIDVTAALKDFEVKEEKSFSSQEKQLVTEGKIITITSFEIGNYVLDPAIVTYESKQGGRNQAESNKLYVTVETVDKSGKTPEDIKGIKGVVSFRSRFIKAFSFLIIFIALAILGFFIWKRYFQKSLKQLLEPENILSPHEEAYRALDQLFNSDLLRRGQYKLYCSSMSEILKRYFERRYQFLALESTTYELLGHLKQIGVAQNIRQPVNEAMNFCDLVKFAKYVPQPAELIEINKTARAIIDITKEREIEEPVPQPTNANP